MRTIPTETAIDALDRAATLIVRARRYWNDGTRDDIDMLIERRVLLMRIADVNYELARLMSEICDEGI